MPQPPLDLLIVGGGPVGLATAVGATHRGAKRVLIVEQAKDLLPVGNSIDLLPNALKTITALAPGIRERLECFMRNLDPSKPGVCVVSATGADIDKRYIGSVATLQWWQLQRLLLDELPDEGMLVLNHHLVDIQHEEGTGLVCAEFVADRQRKNMYKNWEDKDSDYQLREHVTEPNRSYQCRPEFERAGVDENQEAGYGPNAVRVKCKAKVLVGADGINSVARRCVYRNCGPGWQNYSNALYSGITRFSIFGDPDLSPDDEKLLERLYKGRSDAVVLTAERDLVSFDSLRIIMFRPGNAGKIPFSLYMSAFASVHREEAQNASQEDLQRLVTNLVREGGFSEAQVQLFRSLWGCGAMVKRLPFYTVPADHPPPYKRLTYGEDLDYPSDFERPWYHRRVVLAGDAVHAIPPFLAQGSAMGLEDAFELVTLMGQSGIWSMPVDEVPSEEQLGSIFRRYRAGRLNRVCTVQNLTMNRSSEYEVESIHKDRAEIYGYDPGTVAESIRARSHPSLRSQTEFGTE